MLRAPISGLSRAMWPTRSSIGIPTAPVEKLMMMSVRLRISSMIWRYFSTAKLGVPSSLRAWMWTTAQPASAQRRASSAISTGVYGMYSHCLRVVSAPVRAAVMTTLWRLKVSIALLYLPATCTGPLLARGARALRPAQRTVNDRRCHPLGRFELRIVSDIRKFDEVGARPAILDRFRHMRPGNRTDHAPNKADRAAGSLHRTLPPLA